VLHSFIGGPDSASPTGALVEIGGTLYGTTALAGPSRCGTIFSIRI
jgi:uncharacterized repeat protein (TIGR03803 family)